MNGNAMKPLGEALVDALEALLLRDEQNTCRHENTHRGGAIWKICDDCGAQWAVDRGGKPPWEEPPEWTRARAVIQEARQGGLSPLGAVEKDMGMLRLLAELPCEALVKAQKEARIRLGRLSEAEG
jgi:hypothetical protein